MNGIRFRQIWSYRYQHSHTDIQQTDTNTPLQNLYLTDTNKTDTNTNNTHNWFGIQFKPTLVTIVGINYQYDIDTYPDTSFYQLPFSHLNIEQTQFVCYK